jgi:hypothetical protein
MSTFATLLYRGVVSSFVMVFLSSGALSAEEHVVPAHQLRQRVVKASESRRANLAKVDRFFSSKPVRNTLEAAGIDRQQVRRTVELLSDTELQRLAAKAEKTQEDFAAGALNNEQLTYIVIALAAAVIVLIAVT